MQKRSGCPVINCTQSFDHDWLQLLYQVYNVTYFRLLAKSCHYYDYVVRRYRFASQDSAQSFYLLFLFFTIGIKDPEGFGKKIRRKYCRSDHYSGQSSNAKESCSSTPLNRCTSTETRWNKKSCLSLVAGMMTNFIIIIITIIIIII